MKVHNCELVLLGYVREKRKIEPLGMTSGITIVTDEDVKFINTRLYNEIKVTSFKVTIEFKLHLTCWVHS